MTQHKDKTYWVLTRTGEIKRLKAKDVTDPLAQLFTNNEEGLQQAKAQRGFRHG